MKTWQYQGLKKKSKQFRILKTIKALSSTQLNVFWPFKCLCYV